MATIVVGVDGSPDSRRAVEWAAEHAAQITLQSYFRLYNRPGGARTAHRQCSETQPGRREADGRATASDKADGLGPGIIRDRDGSGS